MLDTYNRVAMFIDEGIEASVSTNGKTINLGIERVYSEYQDFDIDPRAALSLAQALLNAAAPLLQRL